MIKQEEEKYYVYVYLNPLKENTFIYDTHTFECVPFYIGRGFGDRFKKHLYESTHSKNTGNRHKKNTINKILKEGKEPIIIKLNDGLTYKQSINYEKYMISLIGRKDLKEGPLTNMTDGGEGTINRKYTKETLDKMRIMKKIIQYDNLGNIIHIWESAGEAGKTLGIRSQDIHKKCRHKKMLRFGGFFWKYYEGETLKDKIFIPKENLPILQYNLDGEHINTFEDSKECNKFGFHSGHILKVCKNNEKNVSGYKYMDYMWYFYKGEEIVKNINSYKRNPKNIAKEIKYINKINIETNTIIESNLIYVFREQGFRTKTILMCCNGKLKTSQGYIWKFK